jgi:cation diffusion facilitator CzcD-associated flavoprotein CzcO
VVHKFGCEKYIKFGQKVVEAVWVEAESKWQLQVSIKDKPLKSGSSYNA